MQYDRLYEEFKTRVPESVPYLEERERLLGLDESDGQLVLFGSVERFVYDEMVAGHTETLKKVAAMMEDMETDEDDQVACVVEQSIIEHLISTDRVLVAKYDRIWGPETKEAFKYIGQWFLS